MKKVLAMILTALTIITMVACSPKDNDKTKEVSQSKKEEKIVAGTVAVAEIFNNMGVELVGRPTTAYELPKELKEVKEIGNPMKPDLEVIKSLNPTLFVSAGTLSQDLKKSLEDSKINSKFLDLGTFEGYKKSIEEMGTIGGTEKEAEKILKDIEEREKKVMEEVKGKKAPKVMIMFGAPGNFMIGTETSFLGDMVKKLGGENVIKDGKAPFIPVNMEVLAKEQPDMILVLTHVEAEAAKAMINKEFKDNKAWQNFKAVKDGNVVTLENGYFGMTANLKTIDALEKLSKILYK